MSPRSIAERNDADKGFIGSSSAVTRNPMSSDSKVIVPDLVRANGIPLVTDGDKDSCMDARQGGSPNVRAPGGAGLGGALGSLGVAAVGALI